MKNSDELVYAGIPTFMGSEYLTLPQSKGFDIAVLGIPIDYGSSYRLGSKYGPRSIRVHSMVDRIASGEYFDLDTGKWIKGSKSTICDLGDLDIWTANPERNMLEINKVVSKIIKNSIPLVLGGDHSITYSVVKAIKNNLRDKSIGVIHFDAHLDLDEESLPGLPEVWHGNPFRKLIEDKIISGDNLFTIGPRGRIGKSTYNFIKKNNINLYTSTDIENKGLVNIVNNVVSKLSNTVDVVYITLDIDCLDLGEASGTGTPKYGGLKTKDLIQALIALKKIKTIGFDLVEVNPKYDESEVTSIIAGELLYNFLSFGFRSALKS